MKKVKRSSALTIGAAVCALVAHSGVALAQGICTATFRGGTATITCTTSLSEDATGFARETGDFVRSTSMSVTYRNGQESAEGFTLDPNGNIICRTGTNRARGTTLTKGCGLGSAPGFFRIIVN